MAKKQLKKNKFKPLKDRFLYTLILSFVFITSSALALSPINHKSLIINHPVVTREFTPIPKIKNNSSFPVVSAQAVLAVDLASGVPLYEKNSDTPLLPASTTKIITALVALDTYPLDQVVKVGKVNVVGQKMGLRQGEEIKVIDLLYGLLVYSANDAAEVLAQNYEGGREAFIIAMNLKASQLSMKNSWFINPTGLDGNKATARDLLRVSEVAMRNPTFSKIVGTKEAIVYNSFGKVSYRLKNINELVGNVPGVLGVKTGWTENARENLVTYIERDGKKIMLTVLGSQDRFGETKELIDWIFENYEWKKVQFP